MLWKHNTQNVELNWYIPTTTGSTFIAFRSRLLTLLLLLWRCPVWGWWFFPTPFSRPLSSSAACSGFSASETLSIWVVIGSLSAAGVWPSACSSVVRVTGEIGVVGVAVRDVGLRPAGMRYTTFSLARPFSFCRAAPRRKDRLLRPLGGRWRCDRLRPELHRFSPLNIK